MSKKNLVFFLIFFSLNSFSQKSEENSFSTFEDTLKKLSKTILNGSNNKEKNIANYYFLTTLEKALRMNNSFSYPFDSLNTIARLTAPDNTFRIFNWHIPKDDGTFEYFGFVQTIFKKQNLIFRLVDKSAEIKSPEFKTLEYSQWFGAHYYEIIYVKEKRNKYYTLLGWDGNDRISNKKIIDVIHFTKNGTPKFGAAIFKMEKKNQNRVIFEYSSEASMSVRFDKHENQIVFDHLSPKSEQFQGQQQHYGPDFSYDALRFKKGKWNYFRDVDARNEKSPKDKLYKKPK